MTQSTIKNLLNQGAPISAYNCKQMAKEMKPKTEKKAPEQVVFAMNNSYVCTRKDNGQWDTKVTGEDLNIPTAGTLADACYSIALFDASKPRG